MWTEKVDFKKIEEELSAIARKKYGLSLLKIKVKGIVDIDNSLIELIEKEFYLTKGEIFSKQRHIIDIKTALCICLNDYGFNRTQVARLLKLDRTTIYFHFNRHIDLLFVKDKKYISTLNKVKQILKHETLKTYQAQNRTLPS